MEKERLYVRCTVGSVYQKKRRGANEFTDNAYTHIPAPEGSDEIDRARDRGRSAGEERTRHAIGTRAGARRGDSSSGSCTFEESRLRKKFLERLHTSAVTFVTVAHAGS